MYLYSKAIKPKVLEEGAINKAQGKLKTVLPQLRYFQQYKLVKIQIVMIVMMEKNRNRLFSISKLEIEFMPLHMRHNQCALGTNIPKADKITFEKSPIFCKSTTL